jgi:hypothetical protein
MKMTDDEKLAQAKAQRRHAQKRAAAANDENARLRAEIRSLRHANFMLQRYIDNPGSQAGYKRRYEELLASVHMAKDILVTELNGLPQQPPTTLEEWRPPAWARKAKS